MVGRLLPARTDESRMADPCGRGREGVAGPDPRPRARRLRRAQARARRARAGTGALAGASPGRLPGVAPVATVRYGRGDRRPPPLRDAVTWLRWALELERARRRLYRARSPLAVTLSRLELERIELARPVLRSPVTR